ncbi:calcium/sodium antiporter [Roseobacter sp. HKCCA0434]|uniref:calcium/sodium antiporter n=1 Tax=Roseobacter sp. HKCCA0434 TaxID=3079297 RepID=UPI002905D30D|nr:calcium/sodium antiporter [Roseobacter sp. HKCCA0434]
MSLILVAAGLALLLVGGEVLVRGAVALATRLGVPALLVGLLIVGFGTSMPELLTSVQAALAGAPGIAVGNVVGSNIANILLILGAAALVAPLPLPSTALDRAALAGSALLGALALWNGEAGRGVGLLLLAALAAYLATAIWLARRGRLEIVTAQAPGDPAWRIALNLALGLGGLLLGAQLLIRGAVEIAESLGVSQTVIGLTIVAVGTSLPELAASLVSARRGQPELAVGNIVGSNIFNILGILGVTALVVPLEVAPRIAALDMPLLLAITLILTFALWRGWRIARGAGAAMLLGYAAYLALSA